VRGIEEKMKYNLRPEFQKYRWIHSRALPVLVIQIFVAFAEARPSAI